MMKRSRTPPPDMETAREVGLQALLFVAEEGRRLARFLAETGLSPDELRQRAGEPGMLAAILDYLLANESELLVFTAGAAIDPLSLEPMRALLAGEKRRWEPSA